MQFLTYLNDTYMKVINNLPGINVNIKLNTYLPSIIL